MKAAISLPEVTTLRKDFKDGARVHVCTVPGCGASFRKLEHATRHSRTHTQIRPYTCSTCSKSFARQDTLNRHCRLHNKDSGPSGKAPRKRRSSASPATKTTELHPAPTMTAKTATKVSTSTTAPQQPLSVPVAPPAFPSYSKPFSPTDFSPIDAFLPMPQPVRRHSDNFASTAALNALGFGRPRANTLAGLPEALGSFSLVASPESSVFSSDSDFDTDDKYTTPEDVKDEQQSQYPSPAFTSHSPSSLPPDSLNDLEAILANDPVPVGNTTLFSTAGHSGPSEGFDFDSFAAAVEGASPPTTLIDFLAAAPPTPPASTEAHDLRLAGDDAGMFCPKSEPLLDFDFGSSTTAPSSSMPGQGAQQGKIDFSSLRHNMSQKLSAPLPTAAVPIWAPYELERNAAGPPYAGNVSSTGQQTLSMTAPSAQATPDWTTLFHGNFPSMALAPSGNGLGLTNLVPNTALLDAYRRKQATHGSSPPAFYVPSGCPAETTSGF
ncbi:hypothetical protein ACM66B_005849 [Microbotryomycetes sp. NB124-2]